MLILAFESSCDETSAAVVEAEGEKLTVLANIVASQVSIHALYGGVVPEIASRAHTESISKITYEALETAQKTMDDIDLIAVTNSPGLIGALLVGVNFAKALAYANNKPLVAVNHIKGHIASNFISFPRLKPPFIAFVASGGHTSIIKVNTYTDYETIGRTRDDAIGEAFDKVGRLLNIPYPAGAKMDALASLGNPKYIRFPSGAIADDTLDFSFSGVKTSVLNHVNNLRQRGLGIPDIDIAASFTKTVCDSVITKLDAAIKQTGIKTVAIAGGVAANSHLRDALATYCENHDIDLFIPPLSLCGDNAAMIAAQGYFEFREGLCHGTDLNAYATKRNS